MNTYSGLVLFLIKWFVWLSDIIYRYFWDSKSIYKANGQHFTFFKYKTSVKLMISTLLACTVVCQETGGIRVRRVSLLLTMRIRRRAIINFFLTTAIHCKMLSLCTSAFLLKGLSHQFDFGFKWYGRIDHIQKRTSWWSFNFSVVSSNFNVINRNTLLRGKC